MRTAWRNSLIGIGLAVAACNPQAGTAEAEAEVARFRALWEQENFQQIYAAASDELRTASPGPQFTRLLSLLRKRFGSVRQTTQVGWNTTFTPTGQAVVLNYDTLFEQGRAAEQFVLKLGDGGVELMGYHLNSPELMNELLEQSLAKSESEAASPPADEGVPVRVVPQQRDER
jgi:hypothetical protein